MRAGFPALSLLFPHWPEAIPPPQSSAQKYGRPKSNKPATAVEMLAEFGADVKTKSKAGFTAFLLAVRNNHIDVAKALLHHGVNVDEIAPDGTSALNLAIVDAYFDLASVLLDFNADPNRPDPRGSPLHTLAWLKKPGNTWEAAALGELPQPAPRPTGTVTALELAQKLLDHGADPNIRIAFKDVGKRRR